MSCLSVCLDQGEAGAKSWLSLAQSAGLEDKIRKAARREARLPDSCLAISVTWGDIPLVHALGKTHCSLTLNLSP